MTHAYTLSVSTDQRQARFSAFVQQHRAKALSLAWRLCDGDAALADELCQDAFVAAWDALAGFRDEAAMSTWFYQILVRRVSRRRRWQGVRDRFQALFRLGSDTGSVDPTPDPPLQKRISAALNALTNAQRETFVMVHMEGFTVAETAAITGRAPGTTKSHLHRALKALRTELHDLRDQA